MSTNSYKEYSRLMPNKHTELARILIKSNSPVPVEKDITVYRTEAGTQNELFTHLSFDILCTLDSEAEVEICSKKIEMKRYSLLFVAPEVSYRVRLMGNGILPVITLSKDTVIESFHRISVLDGVLSGFFADAMWGEISSDHLLFTSLSGTGTGELIQMLITEEIEKNPGSYFIKTQLLMCIFGYLSAQPASNYKLSVNKLTRSEQISKILTYIQDNYRTVTLEKLAEHFHYTVPYVSKLVRSATGLTFTEILREIKFDVCRSLLLNSDLKINKIAEVAGFQNTDHFNRVFKKHIGITPTEFKKKSIDK